MLTAFPVCRRSVILMGIHLLIVVSSETMAWDAGEARDE